MIPLAAIALSGCLAVNPATDRITAGELAVAIPGLTALDPAAEVALAPAPGVARVFHVPELQRLAQRLHWDVEPAADICVERKVSPPDPERFLEAMHKTLPQASVKLIEYGRQPLPEGDLEFPATGLHAATGFALWTGYLHYAGAHRLSVWARVQVSVAVPRVVAALDLKAGEAITAAAIRIETREEMPGANGFLQSDEAALGKWPRAAIHAGTAIRATMLESPKDVVRGEIVKVEVRNGAALLELEAQAEASGSVGETIPVLNPVSHKRFLARVEGKGKVSVTVSVAGAAARKANP
jgi:flagella basal body P-ring formation protein FlgA